MYPDARRIIKSYIDTTSEGSNQNTIAMDEYRPPKIVSKHIQFDQQMSITDVDSKIYQMLKFPYNYTKSVESIVFIRNLNYGLILLKTKTLLFKPESFFECT